MRNGASTILKAFPMAVSLWQKEVKLLDGKHLLEMFSIGKSVVLVQDYPNGDGWNAFVPVTDDGRIDATLRAIAERCCVAPDHIAAMVDVQETHGHMVRS